MKRKQDNVSRRQFLITVGGSVISLSVADFAAAQTSRRAKNMLVYIGTYTSGKSKGEGIYIYKFDMQDGSLTPHTIARNVVEPSFLVIDTVRKYLFAVNETVEFEGMKSGAVSAFAIDQKTGDLRFLNKRPSMGGAPCHLSISADSKFLLVANYVGGNVAVLPIESGGRIGTSIDLQQHSGTGSNKERQEAAHAHSVTLDKNELFAVSCDLGADKIFIYKFDRQSGKLRPNPEQSVFHTRAGAGPRHFVFHQKRWLAFVINELDSTVTSLRFGGRKGTLTEIQTVSTLPREWRGENTCADIHISPNGAFLYASNRGHDSIVSYRIDETSGELELIEHVSTLGKTPRNFAIDPTGKFLLVANQNSDSIVTFHVDEKTGRLQPSGKTIRLPSPVCLKLM